MQLDEVLEYIGEVGLYQVLLFLLTCMISVFGVEAISVNFVAAHMDHWCQVDGLEAVPYDHQRYVAIPQDQDGVYSACEQYDINYANFTLEEIKHWNRSVMISNDTPTTGCYGWVYDQSEFVSSSVSKYGLVCSRQDLVPLISTLFMVGIMVGSFISGPLSDKIGRRPTILIFIVIKIASGLMGTFANNFAVFAVARVFLGIGGFSAYLVAYVLVMELVGPMYRTFLGVGFQMAYSIGILVISGMAYAIRDDKWLQLAYLLPSAVLIIFAWILPESPRWLLVRKRNTEARKVLQRIAEVNERNLPANFETDQIEEEISGPVGSWTDIFRSPRLRMHSIVIDLYWFTVNLIYYALSFNIGALSGSVFVNTVISGAVEIPANIICILLCNWHVTGRRMTCCISLLIAGVTCFIRIGLILKGFDTGDTALCFVGRAFVTIGFSGIYVYASEVFPTEVRNAGLSFAAVFAQISGIVSPYIGGPLTRVWEPLPALIFGVLSLASGFSVLALPETLGRQLFETVQEAENFAGTSDKERSYGSFSQEENGDGDNSSERNIDTHSTPNKSKGFLNPGFIITEFSTKL